MNEKKLHKNQKGYSMVELVVVIAILAVLTGSGITFLGLLPGSAVKGCAREITSQLEKTRTNALSFENAACYLYCKDDGIYMRIDTKRAGVDSSIEQKVGKSNVTVSNTLSGDSAQTLVPGGDQLVFGFDRSSGAFKPAQIKKASGVESPGTYCVAITITGGSKTRTLKLVPLTGKIEQQ